MATLTNFYDPKHLKNVRSTIFDPLSGETYAINKLIKMVDKDGTVSIKRLRNFVKTALESHPIIREKFGETPVQVSDPDLKWS